jgi:hypothetical protein
MAGLVPAIHAVDPERVSSMGKRVRANLVSAVRPRGVDGRDEPGHDGGGFWKGGASQHGDLDFSMMIVIIITMIAVIISDGAVGGKRWRV